MKPLTLFGSSDSPGVLGDFWKLWGGSSLFGLILSPSVLGPVAAAVAAGVMCLIRDAAAEWRAERRAGVAERVRLLEARVAEAESRARAVEARAGTRETT